MTTTTAASPSRVSRAAVLAAVAATAGLVAVVVLAEPAVAATPALAVLIHPVGHVWAHLATPATASLAPARYRVAARELPLYRALRVSRFDALLDAIGWNAVIRRWRGFDGTRRTLPALVAGTRFSEHAHVLVALLALGLAGLLVGRGELAAAGWILGSGVLLHLYPIALQRQVRARAVAVVLPAQASTGASSTVAGLPSAVSPVARRDLRRP